MSSKVEVVSCTVICLFSVCILLICFSGTRVAKDKWGSLQVKWPGLRSCIKARLRTPAPDAVGG